MTGDSSPIVWSIEDPVQNNRIAWWMLTPALAVEAFGAVMLAIGFYRDRGIFWSPVFWSHVLMMPCIFVIEVLLYFMVIKDFVYVNRASKLAFIIDAVVDAKQKTPNILDYSHTPYLLSTSESVGALILGVLLVGVYVWGVSRLWKDRGHLCLSLCVVCLIFGYQVLFAQLARGWTVTIQTVPTAICRI